MRWTEAECRRRARMSCIIVTKQHLTSLDANLQSFLGLERYDGNLRLVETGTAA